MAVIAEKLHETRHRFSIRQAKQAIRAESCRIVMWTKCMQCVPGRRNTFWAAPESRNWGARFDFVEENSKELWQFDRRRNRCRLVMQLRGFVEVDVGDGVAPETLKLAIGRNLQPHEECDVICARGNCIHPMLTVTHCLWRFQP